MTRINDEAFQRTEMIPLSVSLSELDRLLQVDIILHNVGNPSQDFIFASEMHFLGIPPQNWIYDFMVEA